MEVSEKRKLTNTKALGTVKKSRASADKSKIPFVIRNNKDYEMIIAKIDKLIDIPDNELSKEAASELHRLAKSAQLYEKSIYTIKPPSTFEGILEMKMYELKLNQSAMAKKLHTSGAKLSMILSGKQQPDIKFLKIVHENLGIDGNYLLSVF